MLVLKEKDEISSFSLVDPWWNNNSHVIHVKSCLESLSPDHMILHHRPNDLKSNDTLEETANLILNLVGSVKRNENQVFISGLVVRIN